MSIANRTLLAKAAIDTATLGTGGKMNPEQAQKFITFMKDYSRILREVAFYPMMTTRRVLDSLEVNKRGMRKQLENQENAPTGTATPSKRELQAVGVIRPYDITFQYMKENIERGNINDTLAKLFAQQFTNDTVDLAFNGDEEAKLEDAVTPDPFLSINNGWIKIATSDAGTHKFDNASSQDFLGTVFPGLLAMMPGKYYQLYQEEDKSKIKILVSQNDNRVYKHQLQERNTALGDAMILSGKNVTYDGFEIIPVGFIPDGVQMATALENLAYGVLTDFESYHQVVPRYTRHEYTLLADFDVEIVNPNALVIGKDFA
ncbi:P2 family phage major capsid protein [Petroclostridium sp. X23]|uniref:P2 family phage major capsid protein n=1 Tax=Petroclostridium sp. X23 TaxID=3045146 RepID=UPI0024AE8774|nr:P2 family phage major capsid protein [Petroclostridium sp. X23]WHH59161.1 P2 family phage major capsid protein [Petroclostridium sp. X23]